MKRSSGYTYRKCGDQGSKIRKDFSRIYKKYGDTESSSVGTLLHSVKLGLLMSFHLCFEMAITTKGMSALQTERKYKALPGKVVYVIQLTKEWNIKRFYGTQLMDSPIESHRPIFDRHIVKEARVTTDEWKGCRPITKDHQIILPPIESKLNFKTLYIVIQQIKFWIRAIFSWSEKRQVERYQNEYSCFLDRSQIKHATFHNLIERLITSDKIYISSLV